ncbi:unnamed protein product, partial [Polarella glacialis]
MSSSPSSIGIMDLVSELFRAEGDGEVSSVFFRGEGVSEEKEKNPDLADGLSDLIQLLRGIPCRRQRKAVLDVAVQAAKSVAEVSGARSSQSSCSCCTGQSSKSSSQDEKAKAKADGSGSSEAQLQNRGGDHASAPAEIGSSPANLPDSSLRDVQPDTVKKDSGSSTADLNPRIVEQTAEVEASAVKVPIPAYPFGDLGLSKLQPKDAQPQVVASSEGPSIYELVTKILPKKGFPAESGSSSGDAKQPSGTLKSVAETETTSDDDADDDMLAVHALQRLLLSPSASKWADVEESEAENREGHHGVGARLRLKDLQGVCTISVHNIPARYTQAMLLSVWNPLVWKFDLLHLPWSTKLKRPMGYVFLNFWSSADAAAFQHQVQGTFLPDHGRNKYLTVAVAHKQGLFENLEQYRGRSLDQIDLEMLPALFDGLGNRLNAEHVLMQFGIINTPWLSILQSVLPLPVPVTRPSLKRRGGTAPAEALRTPGPQPLALERLLAPPLFPSTSATPGIPLL